MQVILYRESPEYLHSFVLLVNPIYWPGPRDNQQLMSCVWSQSEENYLGDKQRNIVWFNFWRDILFSSLGNDTTLRDPKYYNCVFY